MVDNLKKEMKILLMGGTKDSIDIIKFLKKEFDDVYIVTTTTTDYGGKLAMDIGSDEVITKPLTSTELVNELGKKRIDVLIDGTHPFAVNGTKSAIESSKIAKVEYIRFERPKLELNDVNDENIYHVKSFKAAGELISKKWKNKNILHLAGVNTIKDILKSVPKENFYPRVLPSKSSIEKCMELGLDIKHIIAIEGTFSKEFNKALIKEFNAEVMITKESGTVGGVPSKLAAANESEIAIVLVDRPVIPNLIHKTVVNSLDQLKNKLMKSN